MSVPLKTVLQNPGKMEFNFKIDRPLVLNAYNVIGEEIYFINKEEEIEDQRLR